MLVRLGSIPFHLAGLVVMARTPYGHINVEWAVLRKKLVLMVGGGKVLVLWSDKYIINVDNLGAI